MDGTSTQMGVLSGDQMAIRTFLIADVRGYTRFTVEQGDAAAARLASRFAGIAREVVRARDGEVVELRGDEALAVFTSSRQALLAAAELQVRVARSVLEEPDLPFRIGIGLDAGEAVPVEGGFRGAALNLAARLCSLAGPGEVLASDGVIHLARKVDGIVYRERGMVQLKGFDEPVRVMEVVPAERPSLAASGDAPAREAVQQELPIGGYLGSLPGNALSGRQAELAQALEVVDAVLGGRGKLLLLAGEPGAGKTRLAQEITLALRNRDILIAAGRCYEPQQSVPFYPFLEALTTLYRLAPNRIRREVPQRFADLARLLPQLGLPVSDYAGPQDQQRLFWAVTGFLQTIAAESPLALLLDDLHWADAASLELCQHLARQTDGDRILLLGTYRDVEVNRQHPLEAALRDLRREGLIERIPVRRLRLEETRGLIASEMGQEEEISDEFARLIHERTEGNPFFVQQVLHVLVEQGDVVRKDGRWDRREIDELSVPESIRSVVGQRLSRLRENTQEVLREASVLGQSFGFEDLRAMTERSEQEIEAALDEAVAAGLVQETGRDRYGFDHALTQGALYAELTSRRRRRLHLRAAEAIEALPERKRDPRAAELAWHYLQADDPEPALRWSMRAGDGAETVFAHSDAEYHYRTALQLAEAEGDDALQAEAGEKLGHVLYLLVRLDEAREALDAAAAFYREHGDLEGELRVAAQVAWSLFEQGRSDEGIERTRPTLQRWEEHQAPSPAAASLYIALANLHWTAGEHDAALVAVERAVELAAAVGDERLLGLAESRHGLMLSNAGRGDEALDAYNRSIVLSEAAGDLEILPRSLNNRAILHIERGQQAMGVADYERALEIARRLGSPTFIVWELGSLADHWFSQVDWQRARPLVEELLRLERPVRNTRASAYIAGAMWMKFQAGEWDLCDVEEKVVEAERTGDVQRWLAGLLFLAEWDTFHGSPAVARDRLHTVLAHPELESQYRPRAEWCLALACIALGEMSRADELVRAGLANAAAMKHWGNQALWLSLDGALRQAQGRWAEARARFEESLAIAADLPWPSLRGMLLYLAGTAFARQGEIGEARPRLEEALAIYQRGNALRYTDLIEAAIGDLAQPPHGHG